MLESIASTAAKFAGSMATRRFRDWRQKQRVRQAYRNAAEAAIEHCAHAGHPPGSPTWVELVTLLGDEDAARAISVIFRRRTSQLAAQRPLATSEPDTFEHLQFFIEELNERLRLLLPMELRIATDMLKQSARTITLHSASASPTPTPPPPSFPVIEILHRRNPFLTGRADLLTMIASTMASQREENHVVALHGTPGVGKTQVAVAYAYEHVAALDVVWWIRAADASTLAFDFAALAGPLQLADRRTLDQDESVGAVRRWLSQHDRWLLIFDSADSLDDLYPYLPAVRGQILITSQNPHGWERIGTSLHVPLLSRDSSMELLKHRTGEGGSLAADELAEELGDLPLALEQACVYMEETSTSVAAYLALFREHGQLLWQHQRGVPDHHQTIAATIHLALAKVRAAPQQGASVGADLLKLCAYLAPDPLPLAAIRAGADVLPLPLSHTARDPLELKHAVAAVWRYSLVEVVGDAFSVHKLIQGATRDQLEPSERELWAQTAVRLLQGIFVLDYDDIESWYRCWPLVDHASAAVDHAVALGVDPAATSGLLLHLGIFADMFGAPKTARYRLEQTVELTARAFGAGTWEMARCLSRLGTVLDELGELDNAVALHERALSISAAIYPHDHETTITMSNNLALALTERGELGRAGDLLERALVAARGANGDDSPTTAPILSNLGLVRTRSGDFAEAKLLYERALAIQEEAFGPQSHRIATCLNNLAWASQALGNFSAAREYYERAVAIDESLFGEGHPKLAQDVTNLGLLLTELGELDQAEAHHKRALAMAEAVFGEDHQLVARCLNGLAHVYEMRGDFRSAKDLYERALNTNLRVYGNAHLEVAHVRTNLATVTSQLGEYQTARQHCTAALQILEQEANPQRLDLGKIFNNLAYVHEKRENYARSERYYGRAIEMIESAYGANHPELGKVVSNLGLMLAGRGRDVAALQNLRRAHAIWLRAFGPTDARVVTLQSKIVEVQLRNSGRK